MKLSGNQIQSLQAALLSAFPSKTDLRQMLRFQLDEKLADISDNSDQTKITFDLIEWAEKEGRLEELIRGATKSNSGNSMLNEWIVNNPLVQSEIPPIDRGNIAEEDEPPGKILPPKPKKIFSIGNILCWIPLSCYVIWRFIENPSTDNLIMGLASLTMIVIGCLFTNRSNHIERPFELLTLAIVVIGLGTIAGALNGLPHGVAGAITGFLALKAAKSSRYKNSIKNKLIEIYKQ